MCEGSSSKMAQTDYKVLSLTDRAPRRCCLMQVQPVTGEGGDREVCRML